MGCGRIRRVTGDSEPRALLVVDIEVDAAREDEFNRWYDEEHIPEKRRSEGFYSARRSSYADHTPTVPPAAWKT